MRRRLLKRAAVILGPMLVVSLAYVGVQTWERGALPWERPPVEEVEWHELNVNHRGVRTTGVVHYRAGFRLIQSRFGCTGTEEFEAYLYPLFDPDGWNDSEIAIMLYTTRAPDDPDLDMERRTVDGFLRPLGPDRWDPLVQTTLEERGYVLPQPVQENVLLIEEFVD